MIVTVIAVEMVQVTFDEIIDMITVGYHLVPATGTVFMTNLVAAAVVIGSAVLRVRRINFEDMFLNKR
jgi:hypothetical protein